MAIKNTSVLPETAPRARKFLFNGKVAAAEQTGDSNLRFVPTSKSNGHAPGLLTSWKDISTYLNRGVRTVQRWEDMLGLPVHRMGIGTRAPAFSFQHEIDSWLERNHGITRINSSEPVGSQDKDSGPRRQRLAHLIQELRTSALQLEQEVSTHGVGPNQEITDTLRKLERVLNATLAREPVIETRELKLVE